MFGATGTPPLLPCVPCRASHLRQSPFSGDGEAADVVSPGHVGAVFSSLGNASKGTGSAKSRWGGTQLAYVARSLLSNALRRPA